MSTRSYIVLKHGENDYEYRYHHWDGYINGLGASLIEYFNTPELVCRLFKDVRNDISSLNNPPGDKKTEGNISNWDLPKFDFGVTTVLCHENESAGLREKKKGSTQADILSCCDQEYVYMYDLKAKKWYGKIYDLDFKELAPLVIMYNIKDLTDHIKYYSDRSDKLKEVNECKRILKSLNKSLTIKSRIGVSVMEVLSDQDYMRELSKIDNYNFSSILSMIEKKVIINDLKDAKVGLAKKMTL